MTDRMTTICVLNERWRVDQRDAPEPDHSEWLLMRDGKTQSWCQTRQALLRNIREKITKPIFQNMDPMQVDPAALATIETLPERIY